MEPTFRCDCPFTSAIDILGDKWMLVIVKQMLFEGKETFKDFTESDEAIATNILSAKLKALEQLGMVTKSHPSGNKKTYRYLLTEKGLALSPVLVELATWSDHHLRDIHPGLLERDKMEMLLKDKHGFETVVVDRYRQKLATAMVTSDSVHP